MKLAFIFKRHGIKAWLVRTFTGCDCYHVGFLADSGWFYEQWLMFTRVRWEGLYDPANVLLFDCPKVTEDQLIRRIMYQQRTPYGFWDYLNFAFRPLGIEVGNRVGDICSETVAEELIKAGYEIPWGAEDDPPSPCDLLRFWSNKDELKKPRGGENGFA